MGILNRFQMNSSSAHSNPSRQIGLPCWVSTIICLICFGVCSPAWAYKPESPEVQDMIRRAIAYLETPATGNYGPGGDALIAMAFVKTGHNRNHPLVKKGIDSSQKLAQSIAAGGLANSTIYNEAICLIFLCDLDPQAFRSDIETLTNFLLKRQTASGMWTYTTNGYDDTSQSQYGMLALWAAHGAGMKIPPSAIERSLNWFMRVQDVNGGWAYRSNDPGKLQRQSQGPVTHSMSAAGAGSVYIGAHLLGMGGTGRRAGAKEGTGLPSALRPVSNKKDEQTEAMRPANTAPQAVSGAGGVANAWFAKNYNYEIKDWTHYTMYAIERYESFRELVEGKVEDEPKWYNEGVEFLKRTQDPKGSWKSEHSHGSGPELDTSFSILFLMRSTKKAIAKQVAGEGLLMGGKGLRGNLGKAKVKDGKVFGAVEKGPVDEMIGLLEDPRNPEIESMADSPDLLTLSEDPKLLANQMARLRRLVSAEKFEVRVVAVKTLGRTGDFDNAPILIYALTDPDWRIVILANDSLRSISRRFNGPQISGKESSEERQTAIVSWKNWYKSVNPAAVFLN